MVGICIANPRIHLLGDIGVGVIRAQAESFGAAIDLPAIERLWTQQIRAFAPGDLQATWSSLPFETLSRRASLGDLPPELEFASRLAEFLRTLPEGYELERSALSLLDVYGYAPTALRPDVATESLRLVEASADVVAATPGGRAMLGGEQLHHALGRLRLDDRLARRVDLTALTLDRAAVASGVPPTPLRADLDLSERRSAGQTFVNLGVDDLNAPGAGPSISRLQAGQPVWLWVELGPRNADAAAGEAEPIDPAVLVDGQELEVVVFVDRVLAVTPVDGRVRIMSSGAFPVVRRAAQSVGDADTDDRLLGTRLYFRVEVPDEPGPSRLRVAIYLRGVLVHVEQMTLPVGLDRPPAARTMHQLTPTFAAGDGFASLNAPTLSVYANAGNGSHDFSFYLPGKSEAEPGIPEQLHLDSIEVLSAIGDARGVLRTISWGDAEEHVDQDSRFPGRGASFGDPEQVATALIDLAVMGNGLWGYLSVELERSRDFRSRLQEAMKPPGTVQLSTKEHPSQILPLQVLYDRNLNTASPTYLRICSATESWLEDPSGDPPCLTATCPDEASPLHVCLAGFWGIRHAVSINPAHRSGELRSTVVSGPKPAATLATTTDPAIEHYWGPHEIDLKAVLDVVSNVSVTAAPIFDSLAKDRSVLLYLLAHVDCEPRHPRIWMSNDADGAIDWSTLHALHPALEEHRPVVFINACSSAALSPGRLLNLIDEFFLYGAGGAVGTEITIFVDFATVFAKAALEDYAGGKTLSESLRQARIEGLRQMNPMGFAYISFGLHDLRLVPHAG